MKIIQKTLAILFLTQFSSALYEFQKIAEFEDMKDCNIVAATDLVALDCQITRR